MHNPHNEHIVSSYEDELTQLASAISEMGGLVEAAVADSTRSLLKLDHEQAKAIITGDPSQIDLPKNQQSGLGKAIRILKNINGIVHIELDGEDVVRHRLVKEIIKAYDRANQPLNPDASKPGGGAV